MTKRLLTNSLIFFIGNFILSIFNYLYNTFMGRFLGPASYGVVGSLLAFISIITIPTSAIGTIAMRFTAHYHAKDDDAAVHSFLIRLTRILLVVGLAAMVVLLAISPWLKNFLKLPAIMPLLLVAPVIVVFILLPLNRGILQGLQQFLPSIINQGIDPLIKLTLGIALVKFGLGINGAISAIVVGAFVAYVFSYLPLRPITKIKASHLVALPKEVKQYSLVALVAFLLATVLMNIDILLVKHYLSAHDAGLYTALSSVGKIILFITSPIIGVMFPMISDLQGKEQKHYHLLVMSIVLITVVGIIGVAGYYLFPELIIRILFGAQYISVAPQLGIFGVIMLLYSLVNLWANYFLSIGDNVFVWFMGAGVAVEVVLLSLHHGSFSGIINSLLISMATSLALLTGYYLYLKRQQFKELGPIKSYFTQQSI